MENPKVSVIVPNYNHAPFLKERIESILNQTFQNFELIILDDHSTDNSIEILENYRLHPKVSQYIMNEQNSGSVFKQWIKGISLSKGTYIWIAESDDKADNTFLETVVNAMEASPNAAVCFTGSHTINQNNQPMPQDFDDFWSKRSLKYGEIRTFPGLKYLKHSSSWECRIYNASSAIFRKEYAEQVDRGFLTFKYCGDWFFWCEMCLFGDYIEIIEKLNYFRQSDLRTTIKSYTTGDNYKEAFKVIAHTFQIIPLGWYRKNMILGHWLRKIRKDQTVSKQTRLSIHKEFEALFGCTWIPFSVERINKLFVPYSKTLLLPNRDRL